MITGWPMVAGVFKRLRMKEVFGGLYGPGSAPWKLKARKNWKGKKIWLQWRLVFRMSCIVCRVSYCGAYLERLTAEDIRLSSVEANAKSAEKILEKSKMDSRVRGNDNL